jgi:glutamyl-tRNA synthetase
MLKAACRIITPPMEAILYNLTWNKITNMTVVTRFAPSPTGFLHIGGARTALINYLFARHHGGKYLLRIEDTDRARSTQEAVDAILDGLAWLDLSGDEPPVFQHAGMERHAAVARELVTRGRAYLCYCSPEELEAMRAEARAQGRTALYDGRWRDRDPGEAPAGVAPVVRLKTPLEGETVIDDLVQGRVTVQNSQIDDFILLRADGTPTYMHAVVVDDCDMGITHVIRGDDHLNNAFRQAQLFKAMDRPVPAFAHIPLIHGQDGAKLSKRHGALGVEAYQEMGYLAEALCNYLLRLGWGHGDDEIIPRAQAIEWFDLDGVGRAPSRFDMAKLDNLNGHYLRETPDADIADLVMARLETRPGLVLDGAARERVRKGLPGVKARAKTLVDLADGAAFYAAARPLAMNDKAAALLTPEARGLMQSLAENLQTVTEWTEEALDAAVRGLAEKSQVKLGAVAQPLRAALTGSNASPGIFEVMAILGREEALARIKDIC